MGASIAKELKNQSAENLLVALSGGVDSAVSARMLQNQGHKIAGVYVRTWEHEDDLLGDCPGAKDLADAEAVAALLDIPFQVANFIDFYEREVVRPMVSGYSSGITPNPDILCNRCLLYTSPSPRDATLSRMPSSA